jgi:serine/threonine protein phosphatase PrpC
MKPNIRIEIEEGNFSKSDQQGYISLSEKKGKRPSQQDSGFIGILPNVSEPEDAEKFLQETIAASELKHKTCLSGTTVCSAIVSGEDITVANLGDSRAALIFRYNGALRDRYISVLLTEDHDFDVPRVRNHVVTKGGNIGALNKNGVVYKEAVLVNNTLNMGGSIGDDTVRIKSENNQDCLIRKPDVFHYKISDLCKKIGIKQEKIIDLDLVVSCDGLWNFNGKMECNFKTYIDKKGEQELRKNLTASFRNNLFDIKKSHLDNKEERSFADIASKYALKKGSLDNVSVAHIALKSNKNQLIAADKTIIATICDGHGPGVTYSEEEAIDENNKKNWDGLVVSSSVAADIFVAGQVQEIPGLEITPKEQNYLLKLKDARRLEINSEKQNDSPKFIDATIKSPSTIFILKEANAQKKTINQSMRNQLITQYK